MVRLFLSVTTIALAVSMPLAPDGLKARRLSPQAEVALAGEALDVSSMVRTRFYMSGIAAMCATNSRRDGYELLLTHFSDRGREIIRSAAAEGFDDGVARVREDGGRVDCDEAARNLEIADKTLRTRAEILRPPS